MNMGLGLPQNPTKPTDWSNNEQVQKYLDAKQDYRMALQAMMNDRAEETSTKSNIMKANHDALMSVIQNLK